MKTMAISIRGGIEFTPDVCAILAQFSVVIIGQSAVKVDLTVPARIKALGPCQVGQYTIAEECQSPAFVYNSDWAKFNYLNANNHWYLVNGSQVPTYHGNCATDMSPAYIQWLAENDYATFFKGSALDWWFCDNTRDASMVGIPVADYQAGQKAHWAAIRTLVPAIKIIGNAPCDLTAYKGLLDGALFEAAIADLDWSLINTVGWNGVMTRYRSLLANVKPSGVVGFEVQGKSTDYQRMRFGLTSCLLDDGYFAYMSMDQTTGIPSLFEEYYADIGNPVSGPATAPWQAGVYRRDYQRGIALCNPTTSAVSVTLEKQYQRIAGVQPGNDNSPCSAVTLQPQDGIILLNVLSPTQRSERFLAVISTWWARSAFAAWWASLLK